MVTDMVACSLVSVVVASCMVTALLAVSAVVTVFACGAVLFMSFTRFTTLRRRRV